METFTIHNRLELKPYRKLLLSVYLRKWAMLLFYALFFFDVILICIDVYHGQPFIDAVGIAGFSMFAFGIYFPAILIWTAHRTFKTRHRLTESLTYVFSEDEMQVSGESFSSIYNWEKMRKMKVIGNWLLIYHTSRMFNPIWFNEQDFTHRQVLLSHFNSIKQTEKQVRVIRKQSA